MEVVEKIIVMNLLLCWRISSGLLTLNSSDTVLEVLSECQLRYKIPCACMNLPVVNTAPFPNNSVTSYACKSCQKYNACKSLKSACGDWTRKLPGISECGKVHHCRQECWCRCESKYSYLNENITNPELYIPCTEWCASKVKCPSDFRKIASSCPGFNYLQIIGLAIFIVIFVVAFANVMTKSKFLKSVADMLCGLVDAIASCFRFIGKKIRRAASAVTGGISKCFSVCRRTDTEVRDAEPSPVPTPSLPRSEPLGLRSRSISLSLNSRTNSFYSNRSGNDTEMEPPPYSEAVNTPPGAAGSDEVPPPPSYHDIYKDSEI